MKIAITGATGQLGKELVQFLRESGHNVIAYSHQELDVANFDSINSVLIDNLPNFLVNCAAFTDLDRSEWDIDKAFRVNSLGAGYLASFCKIHVVKLMHISTDAVFSSSEPKFFQTFENTNPINVYGKSKSEGEELILTTYPEGSWIVRTSWLYGKFGGKFVHSILGRSIKNLDGFHVVDDQFGQPTLTSSFVFFLSKFISNPPPFGIYHFASPEFVSRYEFAQMIFELMQADPKRITPSSTLPSFEVAPRPKYSLIKNSPTQVLFEFKINGLKSDLSQFLAEYRRSQ